MTAEDREQARQARNAYKRKWAKDNPDKVRAQQERYWHKRAIATAQAAGAPASTPNA